MRVFAFSSLTALVLTLLPMMTQAEGREVLGYGRLFNNDYFGDNHDRWRTGSYTVSQVRGYEWTGERPTAMGDILELRFRSEIIAPDNLITPAAGDRRYVGAFSFGVHTHFQRSGAEISLGADLVAIGPQTGLGGFQEFVHELVGAPVPEVLDDQLGNNMYVAGTAELAYPIAVSDTVTLRPYFEAQTGVEQIARVGADMIIGHVGQGDLLLRDVPTGQLYRGTESGAGGISFIVGADIAAVGESVYLPESLGFEVEETRSRARAGMHWQFAEETSFFYGVTYLSEEFVGQSEGQYIGSLKLNFNF